MNYSDIGRIVLAEVGADACLLSYDTTEPYWVGFYAIKYGDANPDGTLN